jgi:hypothetical protein
MIVDEGFDTGLQFGNAAMYSAPYLALGKLSEEPLDLVEPG